jgi:hypothetical protein
MLGQRRCGAVAARNGHTHTARDRRKRGHRYASDADKVNMFWRGVLLCHKKINRLSLWKVFS